MKSMKSMMMGGAILLGLAMCLTSCEGTLDDIFGEWSRPTGNNGNTKTTVAVKSVTLDQTTLTKAVGDDAVTLTATVDPTDASDKTVTWKSSDASIAAVDANGKVTFEAAGTATITATATNGTDDTADDKTATCEVTISAKKVNVESVTLDKPTLTATVGDPAVTLKATVTPDDATDKTVTWKSSDTDVATVDENGQVTFKALGTATITATATNGTEDTADDKTATCAVTVKLTITVYVNVDQVGWGSVNFHTWRGTDGHGATTWPGDKVTTTTTVGGKTWYTNTYTINSTTDDYVNFVFSVGSGTGDLLENQTVDVENVTTDKYFEVSAAKDDANHRKVIDVTAAITAGYPMAAEVTAADKGKLICTDGHIHAYGGDAVCTKTRVAKIIYVGTTGLASYNHGLALALADEGTFSMSDGLTQCNFTKNASTPVLFASWRLASKEEWNYMLGANGAGSSTALRDGFSSVGGTNMNSKGYWASELSGDTNAWLYNFYADTWAVTDKTISTAIYVRAALAF